MDEESLGAAGAVVDVSVLGEVDCCFEQAPTTARALRHNNRTLRFIDHL